MRINLDASLVVEPAAPDEFCRWPGIIHEGTTRPRSVYGCMGVPVVTVDFQPFCSEHGEKKLAHSLFQALERALQTRFPPLQEAIA
jgi:hypothetical protein